MKDIVLIEATSKSTYQRKYKCPYCEQKYERSKLHIHIQNKHEDLIPEGYTALRVAFNTINNKTEGHCIMCGKVSDWNEDKGRYERLCNDPKCHEAYKRMAAERNKKKYGTERLQSDPRYAEEVQRKALQGRRIAGKYKFADGGEVEYLGAYERRFLEFMDKIMNCKSEDIAAPGPTIKYVWNGSEHLYISDFYYIPYNLIIEIKDGGDNPNNNPAMRGYKTDRQEAKEAAVKATGKYNYIRQTNNDFGQLMSIMAVLKYNLQNECYDPVMRINESVLIEQSNQNITIDKIRAIASRIGQKSKSDEKPPVGNQNCMLCTWCVEAQIRGLDILPRPVYSPRDILFKQRGYNIVKNPSKTNIINLNHVKTILSRNIGSRYYVHVNWKNSKSGHEFIITNIDGNIYVIDGQAGLVESIDTQAGKHYFNDINYSNSYLVRMDNKDLNNDILKYNDIKYLIEWDEEKDIEYMNSDEYNNLQEFTLLESARGNKIYYGLTEKEAKQKKLVYKGSSKFTHKGVNTTLSGLKRFVKDNNLENIITKYTILDKSVFNVDESVNKDDKYDMIAVRFPFEFDITNVHDLNLSDLNESILFNEKDIYYNKDKFDSGEINLCFITGHSGSGKSTMARDMSKNGIEHYELDDLQCIKDHFTMAQLKEYGDLIYSYFKGPGKKFYITYQELVDNKIPGSEYEDKLFPEFVHYAMQYANSHKNRKFVIEGVWLFCKDETGKYWFKPEEFKDYAFYIKGTSAIISKWRGAMRDAKDKSGNWRLRGLKNFAIRAWKWAYLDEKQIKVFRDYFKKISVNESVSLYQSSKNFKYNGLSRYNMVIVGEIHYTEMDDVYRKLLSTYKFDYLIAEFADIDRSFTREELKQKMDNCTHGSYKYDPTRPCDDQYNYWIYKIAYDFDIPLIGCNPITNKKFKNMNDEDNFREQYMLSTIKEFESKGKCLVQLGDHHLRSIPITKEFLEYCNDTTDDRGIYKNINDLTVDNSSPIWEEYKDKSNTLILRVKNQYNNEINFMKNINKSLLYESDDASKLDKNFKHKSGIDFDIIDIRDKRVKGNIGEVKEKYKDYFKGFAAFEKGTNNFAGFIRVWPNWVLEEKYHGNLISPVEVKSKYREYGLGKLLVKESMEKYNANMLMVAKDNEVAINMYKKLGFYIDKDKKWKNEDYYIMITNNVKVVKLTNKINESTNNNELSNLIDICKQLSTYEYILVDENKKIEYNTARINWDNHRTLSSSDFVKCHGGICYDYVNYEVTKVKSKFKTFFTGFIKNNKVKATHTYLLAYIDNYVYWLECSWKPHIGIYKFNSEDEALSYIVNILRRDNMEDFTVEYKPNSSLVGISINDFIGKMIDLPDYKYKTMKNPKCENIYKIKLDNNGNIIEEKSNFLNESSKIKSITFSNSFKDVKNIADSLTKEELSHICNGTFKNSPFVKYRRVVLINKDPAAFIDVYSIPKEMNKDEAAIVCACKKKYRGQGLIRTCYEGLEAAVYKQGIRKLYWETTKTNKASSHLAMSLGFSKGEDINNDDDNYVKIIYMAELTNEIVEDMSGTIGAALPTHNYIMPVTPIPAPTPYESDPENYYIVTHPKNNKLTYSITKDPLQYSLYSVDPQEKGFYKVFKSDKGKIDKRYLTFKIKDKQKAKELYESLEELYNRNLTFTENGLRSDQYPDFIYSYLTDGSIIKTYDQILFDNRFELVSDFDTSVNEMSDNIYNYLKNGVSNIDTLQEQVKELEGIIYE